MPAAMSSDEVGNAAMSSDEVGNAAWRTEGPHELGLAKVGSGST
jgi:hypothetical protein